MLESRSPLPDHRQAALLFVLLASGYLWALWPGQLHPAAALTWLALGGCALAVAPARTRPLRQAGHLGFVLLAMALAWHQLPGFDNARVLGPAALKPDSVPFTLYLNLDKPLAGAWLLLVCPWIVAAQAPARTVSAMLAAAAATSVLLLGGAWLAGLLAWSPGWPPGTWYWVINNLLLVCITEEALFRGYLQGGLARCGQLGARLALPGAALLFGLAHAAGGPLWIALATVAGLGYGLAYRYGGLGASVGAHFLFNLAHFYGFSYPMLTPP